MYGTVIAHFDEAWNGREVIVFAMFEDEESVALQQVAIEYQSWQGRQVGQRVRRIGKDEIKYAIGVDGRLGLDVTEHVATHELQLVADMEFGRGLEDKLLLLTAELDTGDMVGAAAEEFETD